MERLSSTQIREFIDPMAFTKTRSTETTSAESAREKRIVTSSANESLSLILGAIGRIEDLEYNLQSMREYAVAGAKGGLSDYKYDEYYGALRSLTTGFEQVVGATTFNEKALFDGRDIVLNTGSSKIDLNVNSLNLSGEDSLDLIKRPSGAKVTVGYDVATLVRNQGSGLRGLDISDAKAVERTDFLPELEDGTYKLEIIYEGPGSSIELRDQFGKLLETKEGVDLSGSGQEKVTLDSGIELTIDKLQLLQSYDKWDYENDGPVSLYANLDYQKVYFHELQDGEEAANQTSSVEWNFKGTRDYTGPAINLLDIETNGIDTDKAELDTGVYNMKVIYKGEKSVVELYDADGMLKSRVGGIDLTGDGEHDIDLGTGVRFTFENNGYGPNDEKTLHATFNYTAADQYKRDFDFQDYIAKIDSALEVLSEQKQVFEDAQSQVTEVVQLQQGVSSGTGAGAGAAAMLGAAGGSSSVLGLLGSAGGNSSIFGAINGSGSATSQLNATATQMLSTLGSAGTASANLSSSVMNY
ncbi:MAG: hypothetical protein E1N59_127 [Puniceicoccaceae bacterium 5H]|nr:MAG: hypothetical protein E1N59_127 [Puniceicoccaceae bacterium 5H]